ncbi:hypothetical protein BDZ91DRAFT_699850 [Kalaharituber pfeilii]|nr:hypothetical protein BDZ91DRAFT_699850 [Kalaharituber pfeilii]
MNPDFRESWSPSAVFSPSAARQQLLEAKDWTYIDQWLASHFDPHPVPPFERNSDTLKALLALASYNETADEEAILKSQVESKALRELKERHEQTLNTPTPVTLLLPHLTPPGSNALNSLSLLTVALSLPPTTITPTTLARSLTSLTTTETHLSQLSLSTNTLISTLRSELSRLNSLPTPPQPPSSQELQSKTLEFHTTTHHLTHKSSEYSSRLESLRRSAPDPATLDTISIPALMDFERQIAEMKEHVLGLEGQVKGFQGLPPDKDMARLEVERVEGLVKDLEGKREGVYDKMIR